MSGNISTATATVGDTTTKVTRARGMAFIGIAFGMGFIFGPALGGITSLIRLDTLFPGWIAYGLNPFSAPAVLAFLLSLINLFFIITKFKETLPPEKRGKATELRTANIFNLFKPIFCSFWHFLAWSSR
jgi:MFS family permease